jgi:hypothetical protein
MVKRVYTISYKGQEKSFFNEFDSVRSMESSPLISIPGSTAADITVEEYDEYGHLLKSYEYYDPTRSIEDVLCNSNESKFGGITIKINLGPDEHGILGNTDSPAHIHVSKNKRIVDVNINGPCPMSGKEVVVYRLYDKSAFDDIRDYIAKWAQFVKIQKRNNESMSNWSYVKYLWTEMEKNREIVKRRTRK